MNSKYQVIKVLENYLQKRNCFSWIKLIPVLIYLEYWYYNFPYLELPCLPHHLCQILPQPTETPIQHNPRHVLHRFLYFLLLHSTTHYHEYWIYKPQTKQSQSNLLSSYMQIIIPYGSNTLAIKMLSL